MILSSEQQDALQELLNIGVGRAAGALNQMLEKPIRLHVPFIAFGNPKSLQAQIQEMGKDTLSSVQLPFKGSFSGSAALLFPTNSTPALIEALTGESSASEEFDTMKEATLTEIGNIVLNGVMGSMTNILQKQITYTVPFYQENTIQELIGEKSESESAYMLWAQTHFTIQDFNLSGDILLMFTVPDLELLFSALESLTGPTV